MTADAVTRDVVVTETGGHKARSRVAELACIAARNVAGVLADGCRAVVAADASAEHLCVVDLGCRCESDHGMAVFADFGRRDVISRLAHRFDAVVTTRAVA